jgi:hypothetical protein
MSPSVPKIHFRPLQAQDIAHVAEHLRPADRQELRASRGGNLPFADIIARAVLVSSQVWVWAEGAEDTPVAIFGVAPISLLDGLGSPWFLSTERAYKSPRSLVANGRHYIAKMRESYPNLLNYVDARNDKSIRWLKHLGFTLHPAEPYGVDGEPFHKFEMRTE